MSRISEKVSYLEGLIDGIVIDDENTKKIYGAIIDTLHVIADEVTEHDVCINDLCDALEDESYDDFDPRFGPGPHGPFPKPPFDPELDDCDGNCDDCDFSDSCFYEVVCPSCGETIYFDEDMLDSEDGLICPNCNEPVDISIAIQESEEE